MAGPILKVARGGGRWICDDPECRDNSPQFTDERRVRFYLSPEQELRADRPFEPLGTRKEKKVRKEKRKVPAQTWEYINRGFLENDCDTEQKMVKDLSINNEKTVAELGTDGKDEPKPESELAPSSKTAVQRHDPEIILKNFMKCWGKIINTDIKMEGSGEVSEGTNKEDYGIIFQKNDQ